MDSRYPHGTETRSSKLMCLKNARRKATSLFGVVKNVSENALHASFKVSGQVARAQKSYSLVELIKLVLGLLQVVGTVKMWDHHGERNGRRSH